VAEPRGGKICTYVIVVVVVVIVNVVDYFSVSKPRSCCTSTGLYKTYVLSSSFKSTALYFTYEINQRLDYLSYTASTRRQLDVHFALGVRVKIVEPTTNMTSNGEILSEL
jgi:hypothetical protein